MQLLRMAENNIKAVIGESIEVDRYPLEVGEEIDMDRVLLISDGENIKVGTPIVPRCENSGDSCCSG